MKNRLLQTDFGQNYQLFNELKVSRTLVIQFLGISTAGFFISLAFFGGIYTLITGNNDVILRVVHQNYLVFILLILPIPFHELIYGAVISLYGGKPRYGLGIFYFILPYAYVTTEKVFTRDQFIRICLPHW